MTHHKLFIAAIPRSSVLPFETYIPRSLNPRRLPQTEKFYTEYAIKEPVVLHQNYRFAFGDPVFVAVTHTHTRLTTLCPAR